MEKKKNNNSILLGAALLMATSAVGPGFLTQSATFTATYVNQLAIVIILVICMDIITQMNVWSIVGVSGKRAQDLANEVLPGLGIVIAGLVAFGGLVFNVGNVGGVSLALEALLGIPVTVGCPKLDPVDYTEKLTRIIAGNDIRSVTIVRMEVPCCGGLQRAAENALKTSGKFLPWRVVTISCEGEILDD